jgi:O-antigen ligase
MIVRTGHDNLNIWLIAIVLIIYPFSLKLCNASILVLAVHWLVWMIREPEKFHWRSFIWVLIIPYLLSALSLLYSIDWKTGIFVLDKKFPLFILPIVLGTIPRMERKQFEGLMFVGIGSVLAALIFCLLAAVYRHVADIPGGFFWRELTDPLEQYHPGYLSLYINFLIAWLGIYLFEKWSTSGLKLKMLAGSVIIFLYLFLILLSSKIQLLNVALIALYLVFRFVGLLKLKWVVLSGVIVILASVLFIRSKYVWERFMHISTLDYQLDAPVETFNELTIRFALAECSWEVISANLMLGVGAGDVDHELEKVYYKYDYKFGYLDKQNPHNEYLSQWLATGLIGLLAFLLTIVIPGIKSVKAKEPAYTIFLLLFVVTFLFESVLERQKGIVFFSLFNSLYLFHALPTGRKNTTTELKA